ncbi:hypothetical protein SAMN05192574_104734 [Mucilaginibacter gossypiicola]|uniref:Uncharacterized protein n=1 Tax=Mucilaginibacter gossypiicola TaxID=551995 RepID=A0A1H8KR77_9SPHI|nr:MULTISPECIES: hypothetical protein [Mucilaginibacter]SEN95394.1 hypothetical protein SAMN05192574_104734 [Mucilaginibacter gossypiicola]
MEDLKKLERIVEARMKRKARFEEQIQSTPSMADDLPKGSGRLNQYGMPTIPVARMLQSDGPFSTWVTIPIFRRNAGG